MCQWLCLRYFGFCFDKCRHVFVQIDEFFNIWIFWPRLNFGFISMNFDQFLTCEKTRQNANLTHYAVYIHCHFTTFLQIINGTQTTTFSFMFCEKIVISKHFSCVFKLLWTVKLSHIKLWVFRNMAILQFCLVERTVSSKKVSREKNRENCSILFLF